MKMSFKTIGILIIGILTGTLLLGVVYMIPLKEESPNVKKSGEILEQEGWYPTLPLIKSFEGRFNRYNAVGILDNYTDSIMIYSAASDSKGHPLRQAMEMSSLIMPQGYSYYWHGYSVLLRPALLFLDYGEIRMINQLLQIILVAYLSCLIYQKKGLPWVMLLLTAYGLLMPMSLFMSLQYSWVFYIGIIGSVLVVRFHDFFSQEKRFYILLLLLGMLTSYFDLLTYPLFTWGMPTLWWIILWDKKQSDKRRLVTLISGGFFWILGYGGMWVGKWIIGQIVLHQEIFQIGWSEVMYRSGLIENTEGGNVPRWMSIRDRWMDYANIQTIALLTGWTVWFVFQYLKRRKELYFGKNGSLILLGISPFVWYFVLHNHSYVHTFTLRTLIIFFVAVLAFFLSALEGTCQEKEKGKGAVMEPAPEGKNWRKRIGILSAFIPACAVVFLSSEVYFIHNGGNLSRQVEIVEGQVLQQSFSPLYAKIENIYVGIKAEGDAQGSFIVELKKEEELLDRIELKASDVMDGSFYRIPVNWKLGKGEEYTVNISVQKSGATKYYASVSNEGDFPLAECGNVSLDGNVLDGQLICGAEYLGNLPKLKWMLTFFTSLGIFGVLIHCGLQAVSAARGNDLKRMKE